MKKLTKNGFVGAEVLTRAQLKKVLGGVEDGNPDGPPVEVGGGGGGDCLSRVHASFSDCMQCLIVEKCGSNWLCILACGSSAPVCFGVTSHMCLVKQSNDLKT